MSKRDGYSFWKKFFRANFMAEFPELVYAIQRNTRQQTLDYTTIALGRMGYGEKRLSEFEKVLSDVHIEYCDAFVADRKDDKDMEYTKACLDRELQQYCGSKFEPFEKRYYE